MKKLYFHTFCNLKLINKVSIITFLLFLFVGFTNAQRVVLFEEFTNSSCGPCATYNPAYNYVLGTYVHKVAIIKYQANFPSPQDPMYVHNTAAVDGRQSYYNIQSVPTAIMDGNAYVGSPASLKIQMIEDQFKKPAPFHILVNETRTNDDVQINAQITALTDLAVSDLNIFIVIVEDSIFYSSPPGNNGEKVFSHIMRKMLPSHNGTPMQSQKKGDVTNVDVSYTITNDYDASKLTTVVFVQEKNSYKIHQAEMFSYHLVNFRMGADLHICEGSTGNLALSTPPSGGTAPYSYSWFPSTALSSTTISNPEVTPQNNPVNYTLTVTDAAGKSKYLSRVVMKDVKPIPGFTTTALSSTITQFNNTSTGWTSCKWDLGDGNTSTLSEPAHIYTTPGNYVVKLVVSSACGSDSVSSPVAVGFEEDLIETKIDMNIYPVPLTESSLLLFDLETKENALIQIFDFQGKEIKTVHNSTLTLGSYKFDLNLDDNFHGLFFVRISTSNKSGLKSFIKL